MKLQKREMTQFNMSFVDRQINDKMTKTVNLRELHTKLKNGDEFAHWIKDRIGQYDFVENQDYIRVGNLPKNSKGGRPSVEYYGTINMAKELAMVERNAVGKIARRYFIQCEEELRNQRVEERSRIDDLFTNDFLEQNLDVRHQRQNSNVINAMNVYSEVDAVEGRKKAQNYNKRNCVAITDRTPKSWRDQGVAMGYPRRVTCSAKEVARWVQPEMACARSIADQLVQDGISEDAAFDVGRHWIDPVRRLLATGWHPNSSNRLR